MVFSINSDSNEGMCDDKKLILLTSKSEVSVSRESSTVFFLVRAYLIAQRLNVFFFSKCLFCSI